MAKEKTTVKPGHPALAQRKPQRDAGKQHCAHPVAFAECGKAARPLAAADQRVMPHHLRCRHDQAAPQRPAQAIGLQHPGRQPQTDDEKRHHPSHVEPAQGDGRGFHANLQVIVAINHGVLGVVRQHHAHIGQPQHPGGAADLAHHRSKAMTMPKLNAMPRNACGMAKKRLV